MSPPSKATRAVTWPHRFSWPPPRVPRGRFDAWLIVPSDVEMSAAWARGAGRTVAGAVLTVLLAGGRAGPQQPALPASAQAQRPDQGRAAGPGGPLYDRPRHRESGRLAGGRALRDGSGRTGGRPRHRSHRPHAHGRLPGAGAPLSLRRPSPLVPRRGHRQQPAPGGRPASSRTPGTGQALARRAACSEGDTRCARESGLDDLRARLEPARLDAVRAAHREDIATYERLRDRAMHRAARLLADRPTPHQKGPAPS